MDGEDHGSDSPPAVRQLDVPRLTGNPGASDPSRSAAPLHRPRGRRDLDRDDVCDRQHQSPAVARDRGGAEAVARTEAPDLPPAGGRGVSGKKKWIYSTGDVVCNGWRILAQAADTPSSRLPVYVAQCPCSGCTQTEKLTGPQMKNRAGCFSCRWLRKQDLPRAGGVHWTQLRHRYVAAIQAADPAAVRTAVLGQSTFFLARIVRALAPAAPPKNKAGARRKYQADQELKRITVLDNGTKVVRGGRLVFYTCRCHKCRKPYVWPTHLVTKYSDTGCPGCRPTARKRDVSCDKRRRPDIV